MKTKPSVWKSVRNWWSRVPEGYHRFVLSSLQDSSGIEISARCVNTDCKANIRNLERMPIIDWEELAYGCKEGDEELKVPDLSRLGKIPRIVRFVWAR